MGFSVGGCLFFFLNQMIYMFVAVLVKSHQKERGCYNNPSDHFPGLASNQGCTVVYCCSAKYVLLKYCAILIDYYEWFVQEKLIFLHNVIIMIIRYERKEEMTVLNSFLTNYKLLDLVLICWVRKPLSAADESLWVWQCKTGASLLLINSTTSFLFRMVSSVVVVVICNQHLSMVFFLTGLILQPLVFAEITIRH